MQHFVILMVIALMLIALIAVLLLLACWQSIEKNKKEAETPEEEAKEPKDAWMDEGLLEARRNWEAILAYCKEHHYDMLPDTEIPLKASPFLLMAAKSNYSVVTQTGDEGCSKAYFIVKQGRIGMKLVPEPLHFRSDEGHYIEVYNIDTEKSEKYGVLFKTLVGCVINRWDDVRERLLEAMQFWQSFEKKFSEFDPNVSAEDRKESPDEL